MKSKGLGYIFKSVKSAKISTITIISIVISILFFSTIINAGDIQVDKSAPASNRPQMDKASNEVPVVNIVAPSAGGVSHNKFKEYNVKKQGVILNNSLEVGRSELGGMLYGNPNFQHNKIAADIVLNEVTGVTQTSLAGYTEMFGKPAEFVLANPNGIIVSGGGFINMPRVTLSTGTPQIDQFGDLEGLNVDKGMILINESTLNTTDLNYFELISRTAKIEAEIRAGKELGIKTGRNHYNYKDKSVTPKSDNGAEKPIVAIDSVLLGGMYAGRIYLIATEDGVGVNSENGIGANIEDVTITANGDIVLKKDIEAKRDVTIEAKGDIKQSDKIFAERNIKLKSGKNIEITESSASDDEIELLSGGKTEISSGNKLSNSGNINSVGEISIKSEFISNFGTIKTDKDFRISSFEFDNTNAEIEAIGSITGFDINKIINKNGKITAGQKIEFLNFANFNNKDGSISSGGAINLRTNRDFTIEGDYYAENFFSAQASSITNKTDLNMQGEINLLTKTGSFTNEPDKKIVSAKSVKIETAQGIENFSEITSTKNITLTAQTDIKNLANGKITSGEGSSTIKAGETFYNESEISSESDILITSQNIENAGKIETTNAITTESSTLTNKENGTIQADGDISVTARNNIKNNKAVITSGSNIILQGENGANNEQIINKNGTIEAAGDITIKTDNLENIGEDSGGYTIKYVSLGSEGKNNWRTMGENRVISELTTTPAYLISGGDINIYDATTRNYGSLISAGADINFINGTLKNETSAIEIEIKQKIYQGYYYEKCDSVMGIEYNCQDIHKRRWLPGKAIALSANPATIEAAGDVNIQATEITNKNDVGYEPISDEKKSAQINQTPVTVSYNVAKREKINIEGVKIAYENAKNQAFTSIKTDHQGNYLPQNPGYQTLNQFYGSDYFLIRINYKPDRDTKIKIFSDLYAEQRAIRDALFKATAKRFLHPSITTDAQQLRLLMDNAVKANKNLELALGVELTPQQIAALDEDIIWYVQQEINGEKVLIPRIYLSKLTIESLENPESIIKSRGNINLAVKENITNTGAIQSGKNLTITSKNITNRTIGNGKQATIAADGSTTLTATQNITNTSGLIQSGDSLTLQTKSGDITNQTAINETKTTNYINSTALQTATINSTGNLFINSGANITNTGAHISALADATITATNNIAINTIKTRNYSAIYFSGGHIISDRIENTGSNLNIYGNLNIEAKNLAIIASNINVQQNATITAQNNFELASAQDSNYFQSRIKQSGFLSSKTTKITKSSTKNITSSVNTRGDLEITAQNQNIEITGSSLTTQNNALLEAGKNINITAAYDTNFYDKQTKKSGLFSGGALYSKEKTAQGTGDKTAVKSNITAQNLTINSGQQTNIIGAEINAENAKIETGQNLTITSAPEQHYSYSYSQKTTFGLGSLIGGNLGDFDFKDGRLSLSLAKGEYSKQNSRTDTTTQNPTNIKTQQNIALNSDKNIEISGSNINAGQDITLAAKQNIDIIPTTETEKTKTEIEKGEVELSLGVTHETTDIYYAAKNLNNSTRQLKQAKEDYEAYEKALSQAEQDYANKIIDKQDLEDLKEDKKYYQANIALLTASLAAATKETTQTIAAAGSSASTFGFNFDIQLDIDALQEQSSLLMYLCRPSYLTANKNITIASGKNTHIIGSQVIAGKNLNITAKNTDITAGEEKSEKSYDSKHIHTIVSYALHGGLGGSASANSAKNITKTTNYINARLEASDIKIKSSANTNIKGAELTAAKDITLETGNDLTVESLQDTYKQKSLSLGASVGYSRGSKPENSKATNPQANAGANFSTTNGKSKWVNEQTRIIGGGAVNLKVGDKTELKGATIASASDKLTFDTGSFEYADIRDKKTDSTIGAGLNWSKEYGTKPNGDSYASEYNAYAEYGFTNKSQLNRAVIGAGNIIIRDNPNQDISGLKRNLSYARIQTKNTGVNLRLDTDTLGVVLNPIDTVKEIKEDTNKIYQLGNGAYAMTEKGIVTEAGLIDTLDAISLSFNAVNAIEAAVSDPEIADLINNAENYDINSLYIGAKQLSDLIQKYNISKELSDLYLVHTYGINNPFIATYLAAHDDYSDNTYLNIYNTDITKGGDIVAAIQAEAIRKYYADKTDPSNDDRTASDIYIQTEFQKTAADIAKNTWNSLTNETETTNPEARYNWNEQYYNSDIILYGNLQLNSADPDNIKPFTPDTLLDAGFISYDLYKILTDNIIGNEGNLKNNIIALGADFAGLLIPIATGLGTATKTANKIDNVVDVTAKADEVVDGISKLENKAGDIKKVWSKRARIKKAQLPTQAKGKLVYVPPKNWHPSSPLPRGPRGGYMDKFGNEWTKGPSRTRGQPFEWDVQRPDGSHWNVSIDGKVTH